MYRSKTLKLLIAVVCAALGFSGCGDISNSDITVKELRCEYRVNPLGINTVNPRLGWVLESQKRGQLQRAYQILVSSNETGLDANKGDLWDTGKVDSSQSTQVVYQGGKLASRMKCYWKVQVWDRQGQVSAWSQAGVWRIGLLDDDDWKASWITIGQRANEDAAPMFRREFKITKHVEQAHVYVCGLGYYELSINGQKVGDHVLDPGQTDYEQRVFYVVYDVTDTLNSSLVARDSSLPTGCLTAKSQVTGHGNVIGVILGDGWYNQNKVWTRGRYKIDRNPAYGKVRLLLQLEVTYSDGTSEIIITDENWKTATGPIISSNIYAGEYYDARLAQEGWCRTGFDDRNWQKAQLIDGPGGKLVSQSLPAIKQMKTIKPVGLKNPEPGVYVYDMGQNFAGWARLKIAGKTGQKIQLRFAENIFDNGMIDPASCGTYATGLVQTDTYICKGTGLENWQPRFTYHGFRYVEMTGFSGTPSPENLKGVVVYTSCEKTGDFECSDEMLNRIHETALWTLTSNMHSIVTDCPHREKCQWLGDILAEMMIYSLEVPLLLTKFQRDIETTRRGSIPFDIAPGRRLGGHRPDWGSTFIQLPWYMYLYYGDIDVARQHYEGMTIFMEHLKSIAKDYIIYEGYGDLFEPGSIYSKRTPVELTSTAMFYFNAKIMAELSTVLNKTAEAESYNQLAENIRAAFNKKFYNAEQKSYGSQTADAMALYLELVPPTQQKALAESLARDVVDKHNSHHSTGHMGSRYLYGQLSRYGYGKAAQDMLNQTTYPSIGELFKRGATTFWEHWGEKHISQNARSQSHPFQSGYDAWFFQGIAGIRPDPDNPGFKNILLQPQLIGNLTFANAYYRSIYGLIESKWQIQADRFQWYITIPANTTATVYVPTGNVETITESGRPAAKAEGVNFVAIMDGRAVYNVGSGSYSFVSKGEQR